MKRIVLFLSAVFFVLTMCQAAVTIKVNVSQWGNVDAVYLYDYDADTRYYMQPIGESWFSCTVDEAIQNSSFIFENSNGYYYSQIFSIPSQSTCYTILSETTYNSKYGLYLNTLMEASCPELVETTIRFNPYSVDWDNAYCYILNNRHNYYSVAGHKMILAEDGWWTYTFESIEGSSFYLAFSSSNSSSIYSESISSNAFTESTCFEYNTTNGSFQATTYKSILADESNTYTINVVTPGTLGMLLVNELSDKSWGDILGLNVIGSLNENDMAYFYRMSNLQQLDLSQTNITAIGGCQGLSRLSKVLLPSTCTAINDNAFSGCRRLQSINLSNIQTVGNFAFYQCFRLPDLNMPNVLSVGNYAFAMGDDYYGTFTSSLQMVNMPIVQTLGSYAFGCNRSLSSVTIPLASSIGSYAFSNCYALVQMDLSNVTSLGQYAFYMYNSANASLSQVTLSNDLETIPAACFSGCENLTSITLPNSLKAIGEGALPYITDVQLPTGVTSVGRGNFTQATSINIPANITQWEAYSSSWQDVYCYVVAPLSFNVFNTSSVSSATLHVPAASLAAYKLHDTWYHFGKIIPIEGDVNELSISSDFTLLTTDGIANNANLTINDGGALTMSAANTLSVGNYVQQISSANKEYNYDYYYDANDNRVYTYYSYMPYTGMLLANSAITANSVTVKLVPRSNRWNFFSLPFDVNMSDITIETEGNGIPGTSQWVIREYSGANRASGNGATWNNVPTNGMLRAYTGYILYWVVDDNNSYDNQLIYKFNMPAVHNSNMQKIFATNDVIVPLTEYSAEFPQNRSWNLVGNPYPCSFDIQQMDFDAPITVWDGNGYRAYSVLDDDYTLRPAEAFFVQAPQGTTQITFHKEGRSSMNMQEITQDEYNNNRYYAPKRLPAVEASRKVFNFTLSNADYSDRARLVLNAQASADYELTCDAAKMLSSDRTIPQLYINDNGIRYAIDERPEQSNYILGAYFGKTGEYTIKMQNNEAQDTSVLLTDTETQSTFDLSLGEYTFTTEQGTFDNRFVVSFIPRMPSSIDEATSLTTPIKTFENGHLMITTPQGKKYTVGGIEL